MSATSPRTHRGISLVELLVGMAIGLLSILLITQVFLVSEEQRRIPTSGANTHINGMLALDALQRDILHAGYGIASPALLGCSMAASNAAATIGISGARVQPVLIEAGSSASASDSITVLASNKVDPALPIRTAANHAETSLELVVQTAPSTDTGDWMLVAPTDNKACQAFQIGTVTPNGATTRLTFSRDASIGALAAGSPIFNLGPVPHYRTWSIGSGFQLQLSSPITPSAAASDAYSDIVLMRAFYAKDTNGDGSVDRYDTTVPTDATQWAQVVGVRIAIVARSPLREREPVTTTALQWDLGEIATATSKSCTSNGSSQCIDLDVSATGSEWPLYRYKVFDTMVPIRNLLWNSPV